MDCVGSFENAGVADSDGILIPCTEEDGVCSGDSSFIFYSDRSIYPIKVGEIVDPVEIVIIRNLSGSGVEGANVDNGVLAEDNTCGIDKVDLAVGFQRAEDVRGVIRGGDAVEHAGARIGLDELYRLGGADIKTVVMNNTIVTGSDVECIDL